VQSSLINRSILVIVLLLASSCHIDSDVSIIGDGYGVKKYGGSVPHSSYIICLMRQKTDGGWVVVWHALSARVAGTLVLGKAVLFGGVTDVSQEEMGQVRLLYYSEKTGVVDITNAVASRANIEGRATVNLVTLRQVNEKILITTSGTSEFRIELSAKELGELAQSVVGQHIIRVIDGIEIFE
jgi:hypothetical protein